MDLLNHGMQYSMDRPLKTYWTNLLAETERAIRPPDTKLQNSYRIMAAKKTKQICNSDNHHKTMQKRHSCNIRILNQRLVTENAILVQADKVKTIVIINSEEYSKKVQTFLTDNNFHLIRKDAIVKYQKLIQKNYSNATYW